MADASLGTAVLRTKLDSTGLKTGLDQAKTETERFGRDATTSINGIGVAFGAIAASAGVRAYLGFMRESATLAHQATASSALFTKALERNGQSASEGAAMVQRLADKFGVVNSVVEESATFMLRQGASVQDVERALTAAGASAAAAGFDISTAFNNVGVAVATGRSQLLETSGIVANLGPVAQAYAKSVGKTVEQLTQQELIQARVNAIYAETASEIEDVDILLKGLPRSQAEVSRQWRTFRETAGDLALKVLVPLNEGLATGLRFVNSLPTPVKNAGIAMTGAAIGATALATGFVAIKTALTGLSGLGLLSFGPAGWIVLGVTAVAGLVAVLAGGGNSLKDALDTTRAAIAGGSKDSMIAALDELAAKVSGPVKESLEGMRSELVKTGDVGVEQAQRILTEVARAQLDARRSLLGVSLFGPSPLGDALATGGALLGKLDLKEQVRAALDSNDLLTAIDLLQDAIVAMTEANLDPRRSQPLVDFLAEVGRIPNFKFTPAPTPTTAPTPTVTSAGAGGVKAAERTWQDVLAELDKAGTEAMREAQFYGTEAAFREAAQKRVRLIEGAITEGLTTFFGTASQEDLQQLLERRAKAANEALIDAAELVFVVPGMDAQVRSDAAALLNRAATFRQQEEARRQAELDEVDRTRARIMTQRGTAGLDGLNLALLDGANVIGPKATAAVQDAIRSPVDALTVDLTAAGGVLAEFAGHAGAFGVAVRAAADQAKFAEGLQVFSDRQRGVFGRGSDFAVRPASAEMGVLFDALADAVQKFKDGKAGIDDVRAAVDALTTVAPMSVAAINRLTDGVLQLERAALDAARAAEQNERAPMWVPAGGLPRVPVAPLPTSDYQGFRPRETGDTDKAFIKAREEQIAAEKAAAEQFKDTVISAGISFAGTLAKGLQTGDTGSIVSGLFGVGGSILGAIPGIGTVGTIIAGLLPIVGDLFGGLLGGGGAPEPTRRADGATVRGAPAIDLSIIINQSLNVQSLTDTTSRRAVDDLLLATVRRLEDTVTRNVIPRLNSLDGSMA